MFEECGITALSPLLPGALYPKVEWVLSMVQIDLFEIMFKMILDYINTLDHETLILQLSLKILTV